MTEYQKDLVNYNHSLIYFYLNKHNFDIDDYYHEAAYGLYKAAVTYDASRGSFSNYAMKVMHNEVLQAIRHSNCSAKRAELSDLSLDSLYDIESDADNAHSLLEILSSSNVTEEETMVRIDVSVVYKSLPLKKRNILSMLLRGYTQAEIAQKLQCSRSEVCRCIKTIRKKFESRGYSKYNIDNTRL